MPDAGSTVTVNNSIQPVCNVSTVYQRPEQLLNYQEFNRIAGLRGLLLRGGREGKDRGQKRRGGKRGEGKRKDECFVKPFRVPMAPYKVSDRTKAVLRTKMRRKTGCRHHTDTSKERISEPIWRYRQIPERNVVTLW